MRQESTNHLLEKNINLKEPALTLHFAEEVGPYKTNTAISSKTTTGLSDLTN